MEIKKIFEQILSEEVQNKKLFSALMSKWSEENPEIDEQLGEKLYDRFQQIKNNLNPKLPQVASFLNRFDGQFGYHQFDPNNLKDITKYTYKQIKSLIDEYTPLDELVEFEDAVIFDDKDTGPTPEKINSSKDLWFGDRYCIVNVDGFRVYDIPDQPTSVKFGFYAENVNQTYSGSNAVWCVTWRKDQGRTNQWSNYRGTSYKRSFYFVIDESKHPDVEKNREINKYYLSALQISPMITSGYILTSVKNDGDNAKSWNEIVSIYPKLAQSKEFIKNKPYSDKELNEQNLISRISEAPGQYEFRRQEKNVKRAYINGGGVLQKPESWKSMDGDLKSLYINITTRNNVISRFANYTFLSEIKKSGNDLALLNNRLKSPIVGFNTGVGVIYEHLIKNDYKPGRTSKDNPNVILFESKTDGKFGIFSSQHGSWVKMGGIEFEPIYKRIKMITLIDDKKTPYIVEIYSSSNSIDEHTFYALFPFTGGLSTKAHFLTAEAYNKLTEKMSEIENKGKTVTTMNDFEPGTDVDIKETKKGV
jgi:hypothetical protein